MYMQSNQPIVMQAPNYKKEQSAASAMMWGAGAAGVAGAAGEGALRYVRKGDLSKVDKFDTRVGDFLRTSRQGMDELDAQVKSGKNIQGMEKVTSRMNSISGRNTAMRMGATMGLGAAFGLLKNKSDGVI